VANENNLMVLAPTRSRKGQSGTCFAQEDMPLGIGRQVPDFGGDYGWLIFDFRFLIFDCCMKKRQLGLLISKPAGSLAASNKLVNYLHVFVVLAPCPALGNVVFVLKLQDQLVFMANRRTGKIRGTLKRED